MTPFEVAASYDQIANVWAGDKFSRANGISQHRRAIQFVAHRTRAIDVGCESSGRYLDLLKADGFEVEGLDLSSEMIRLARSKHPAALFHHADVCSCEPSHAYGFISAWDSIWHVPLDQQEFVLRKLCRALAEGGVFIWTTGGLDGPAEKKGRGYGPANVLQCSRYLSDSPDSRRFKLCLQAPRI